MKYFRRYFSAFVVCVFLLAVFSVTASAEVVSNPNYYIDISAEYNSNLEKVTGSVTVYPNNDTRENALVLDSSFINTNAPDYYSQTYWRIKTTDSKPLVQKGGEVKFSLYGCYYSHLFEAQYSNPSWYIYLSDTELIRALILYENGDSEYIVTEDFSNDGPNARVSVTFTPKDNVRSIEFIIFDQDSFSQPYYDFHSYLGEIGNSNWSLVIDQKSEESGLLSGIKDKLTGGFADLGNKITNVFNSITELPSKIWSFIENGLKSLFVPDDDFIVNFKNDMEDMLSNKLGAVYQVLDITLNSWDRIKANDISNTIELPKTTINLPDNNSFSFGGYQIAIVPDGFNFLVTIIKTIVGVACTLLFVNGLRKKYEEVMGVEQ